MGRYSCPWLMFVTEIGKGIGLGDTLNRAAMPAPCSVSIRHVPGRPEG